jgi:hypothetical protein
MSMRKTTLLAAAFVAVTLPALASPAAPSATHKPQSKTHLACGNVYTKCCVTECYAGRCETKCN